MKNVLSPFFCIILNRYKSFKRISLSYFSLCTSNIWIDRTFQPQLFYCGYKLFIKAIDVTIKNESLFCYYYPQSSSYAVSVSSASCPFHYSDIKHGQNLVNFFFLPIHLALSSFFLTDLLQYHSLVFISILGLCVGFSPQDISDAKRWYALRSPFPILTH